MSEALTLANQDDLTQVQRLIERYCAGLYRADTQALAEICHPDLVLKAPGLRRSLAEWLALVASREVPAQAGQPYNYQILMLDICGDMALVKVDCPVLTHKYVDYLSLLKEDHNWRIVSKIYTEK